MRNVWMLIQREYLERVRAARSSIFTLLMPAFMAGTRSDSRQKIEQMNSGGEKRIVMVANDPQLATAVGRELARQRSRRAELGAGNRSRADPERCTPSRSIPIPATLKRERLTPTA